MKKVIILLSLALLLLFSLVACKQQTASPTTFPTWLEGKSFKVSKGSAKSVPTTASGYWIVTLTGNEANVQEYNLSDETVGDKTQYPNVTITDSTENSCSFTLGETVFSVTQSEGTVTSTITESGTTYETAAESAFPLWLVGKRFQGNTTNCGFRFSFFGTTSKYKLYTNFDINPWNDEKANWQNYGAAQITGTTKNSVTINYGSEGSTLSVTFTYVDETHITVTGITETLTSPFTLTKTTDEF